MADSSGSAGILGVIVGVIIVVALGLFLFGGIPTSGTKSVDVNVNTPSAPSGGSTPAR